MTTSVLWFRRDLRLSDNPALLAARDAADDGVVPLFVVDPALWGPSGSPRQAFLVGCLHALAEATEGALVVRHGDPRAVVPQVAREVGAQEVHVARDVGPYGRRRDADVASSLPPDARLVETGTAYAVAPGRLVTAEGGPYRVFTPFSRAWRAHGWRPPASPPRAVGWRTAPSEALPDAPELPGAELPGAGLPEPGEAAARAAWQRFLAEDLDDYAEQRDRPDLDATSRMSAYLHLGCLHPRTLLADLRTREGSGREAYERELCFRDFYADVLWHRPDSAREYYRRELAGMAYDSGPRARALVQAWERGRTGFPIVDAAMRQMLAEGWMHNRMRMLVASFYVKDLHQEWQPGARYFLQHLVDGDLASNNHGWQWVAGTGTDAAPYYRVFNPVTQGQKFDPSGDYVRRWVPELRGIPGKAVHTPWDAPGGLPDGYPERVVDHAREREVALERYQAVREARVVVHH